MKSISGNYFIRMYFGIFLFFAGIISITICIIDPAFHFHAPIKGMSYVLNKERYQNDGIVKHFDYDSLITGTSMVENTNASEVNALFDADSVKVCFMGATYNEISNNINTALEHNKRIKRVFRATDLSGLISSANAHISNDPDSDYSFPTYLYDSNILNDIEYILNLKMFEYALQDIIMTLSGEQSTSFDVYSNWNGEYSFSKESVIKSFVRSKKVQNKKILSEEDKANICQNVTINIIKQANDNPEVIFYIWVPPYSICYYDEENQKGNLERVLDALEYELELLSDVSNIKLFCFVDRYDIVTDLSLYKDRAHFCMDVNSLVVRAMSMNDGLITNENYRDYMKRVREFYLNYDYESIYE